MKTSRIFAVLGFIVPTVSFGAVGGGFQNASQLLTAARRGDVRTVQILINNGADVNYVDSTGLSLVCTAVMNNDQRAIQVLQMYGADASNCDNQIKNYRRRLKTANTGEEYGFFSGLSSSHVLALSAVGVAGAIAGVALLTDVFDGGGKGNNNSSEPSGGSHSGSGSGGGGTSTVTRWTAGSTPYGPAYLNADGSINSSYDPIASLSDWDTGSNSLLRKADFNYLRGGTNNFIADGLNSLLQNYLLVMRGYYPFVNGYMGQNIFRDSTSHAPQNADIENAQGRPVRVALITGNGINPAGSADSANGITYAISTAQDSSTPTVDKYLNNALNENVLTERSGYDFSGSGSAFNPYANVNDSALAKIVAGWEGARSESGVYGDLYGFVPNGNLAIYRTGNGTVWETVTSGTLVGSFDDVDGDGVLSEGDTITINGATSVDDKVYTISLAVSSAITNPTLTIGDTTYKLSSKSKVFLGTCSGSSGSCDNIAVYVGTDGGWYINTTGGNDIDYVYINDGTDVYTYKEKNTESPYFNFSAMSVAAGTIYSIAGDTSNTTVDLIANTNVIPQSRENTYLTTKTLPKAAHQAHISNLQTYYSNAITAYYGGDEGGVANTLFLNYNTAKPMIIMPAGDYLYGVNNGAGQVTYNYDTLDATFENYAPLLYGNTVKHNFMTVVGVSYNGETGTTGVSTISGFADGVGGSYGKIVLSQWLDSTDLSVANIYSSRKCGIAGTGGGIDPWCFAASGPTAEIATASAAGAVASVKAAFSYMSNDQVFRLLALTADGPYLGTSTSGASYTKDTLKQHLQDLFELPYEYGESSLSTTEYLDAFADVFGYGLINLERAIKPGYAVYYYSSNVDNIVADSGGNQFWGNVASANNNSSRASTVLSLTNRSAIKMSFYDIVESVDGTLSLPRVWTNTLAMNDTAKRGVYLGDVLNDFDIDSTNKQKTNIGNMTFSMSMSNRAYNDNLNGLDNMRVAFANDKFNMVAEYQKHLTDNQSRFSGRANGVLALVSNAISGETGYKYGNFGFGTRMFTGTITDENLLANDPVMTSQFEPGRLGFVNGANINTYYDNEKVMLNVSLGNMHETNTVLGMYSDGLLAIDGGDTTYVDVYGEYKPMDNVKLSLRGTFAETNANAFGNLISNMSNIKSNAFAFGVDVGGFSLTAALPLSVVNGTMGYDYAEFNVVENGGDYEIVMLNPHVEYVDLSAQNREIRFGASYKKSVGAFTDAGIGFIYRVNPDNTDAFGNESVFMFKIHHRLGI